MNLHQRDQNYDTVERSESKPRVIVQGCLGYRLCIGTRGVVLCKSQDVKAVPDAASVFNTGGKDNGGVGAKMGYIYSSSGDFLVQGSTCEFCWLINTKWRIVHLAATPGTL
jgi:hypothetical protein